MSPCSLVQGQQSTWRTPGGTKQNPSQGRTRGRLPPECQWTGRFTLRGLPPPVWSIQTPSRRTHDLQTNTNPFFYDINSSRKIINRHIRSEDHYESTCKGGVVFTENAAHERLQRLLRAWEDCGGHETRAGDTAPATARPPALDSSRHHSLDRHPEATRVSLWFSCQEHLAESITARKQPIHVERQSIKPLPWNLQKDGVGGTQGGSASRASNS